MTSHLENSPSARNPAEYPILGLLAVGPAHGYEICRVLRAEIGPIWRLGKSQVYALLAKLERDGLVTHQRVGQENFPSKNVFTVTQEGRKLLMAWVSAPVTNFRDLRLEFLTKLHVAGLLGADHENRLVREQLAVCIAKADELRHQSADAQTALERRAVAFRLTVTKAAISWLEELSAEECTTDPTHRLSR